MGQRGRYVADQLQGLGKDEAVKGVVWNDVGRCKVGDDGCAGVARVDVQDIAVPDRVSAEFVCVAGVADLEHSAANDRLFGAKERLNVVAIDRQAPIQAPAIAERRGATQGTEQ